MNSQQPVALGIWKYYAFYETSIFLKIFKIFETFKKWTTGKMWT